jgi:hypothetical protein
MFVQVTKTANRFERNSLLEKILLKQVRWCLIFVTGNVTDRPRAGRPRKTTPREDRLISRRARQRPFSTAGTLRGNLAFGGHISTRTVRLPSRTYKSNLQSKEKQPQTVTPPPPKTVVPKMWLS